MRYAKRMDNYGSDVIEKMFAAARDPQVISFAGGAPAPELYPIEEFRIASDKAFEEYGKTLMAYDGAVGVQQVREHIAKHRMYGVDASADDIRILSGSQQGIDFAARIFLDEGDTIICEDPTYLGALNTFASYKPNYATVPMDEDGMIMEELEKVIEQNPRAKFIYTVPDFQNPTGITMSVERRKRLVELAEQSGIPVIEDSPYVEVTFEGEILPAIKSFDTQGMVIYLGSFSKTFSPGVRLGWVCANQDLLYKYCKIKEATDFQASTMAQLQLAKYLEMFSLDEHIQKIIPVYKGRRDAAIAAMEAEFPEHVTFTRPKGGYFTWVNVPGVNTTELFLRAAKEVKVAYVPGASAFANGGDTSHIRLSYSQMTEDNIAEGIARLAKLIRSL